VFNRKRFRLASVPLRKVLTKVQEEDKMKSARWIVRQMRIDDVFQWVVISEKSTVVHNGFSDRSSAHDFAYYLNSSQV
jgi:hypothetical protein